MKYIKGEQLLKNRKCKCHLWTPEGDSFTKRRNNWKDYYNYDKFNNGAIIRMQLEQKLVLLVEQLLTN